MQKTHKNSHYYSKLLVIFFEIIYIKERLITLLRTKESHKLRIETKDEQMYIFQRSSYREEC